MAIITGTVQLFRKKGTPVHARNGNVYFISMVIANLTALVIFREDAIVRPGQGLVLGPVFGVFHRLAIITLVLVVPLPRHVTRVPT